VLGLELELLGLELLGGVPDGAFFEAGVLKVTKFPEF
jgi:hypothetical protein